ncbi:hypothetical protein NV63_06765 [Elizabethkingia anophelis]|nr:hypothetical protein NV63_06765 [Elizabethkingia anophelis]
MMETPKEKAIKAAYGDMWIYMSSFPQARKIALENEGWVFITHLPSTIDRTLFDFQHGDSICRPKSLSGIENNRGWTRIESEEDMPKDRNKEDLLIFTETGEILVASSKYLSDAEIRRYWIKTVSHWQKFVKPNPPIF